MEKLKKIFKRVIRKINSINKTLLIFLVISLVSIIIMDLFLKKIQAPFELMYVLGELYYNVCLVYCTSFIFYIITVHIPQERRKLSLYKYINNKICRINDLEISLLMSIMSDHPYTGSNIYDLTENELKERCNKINPNDSMLVQLRYGYYSFKNWFEAFNYYHMEFKEHIKDLLIFGDCLNDELINMLTDIDDLFENHINNTKSYPLANKTMDIYSRHIWEVHVISRNLIKEFRDDTPHISEKYHANFRKKNLIKNRN